MSRRTELGTALRAWRERISPADIGLPVVGDRRVPGLRREELALLVGISVDYLVQLEQGRLVRPSTRVLGAFARELRLNPVDRKLLYRLAGSIAPPSGSVPHEVPCGVQRMIDRMNDTPVAVFTAAWEAVQWNPLWGEIFGDPAEIDARKHHLIWGRFAVASRVGTPCTERGAVESDAFERTMVSDLRRASDRYPDDRAVAELISGLLETNPRFAETWTGSDPVPTGPFRKTVTHQDLGPITLDFDILTVERADLRIVLNWAEPNTRAADLLDVLRVRVATVAAES